MCFVAWVILLLASNVSWCISSAGWSSGGSWQSSSSSSWSSGVSRWSQSSFSRSQEEFFGSSLGSFGNVCISCSSASQSSMKSSTAKGSFVEYSRMEDGELVTIKEITRIDKNGDKIVKKFKNNKESKY